MAAIKVTPRVLRGQLFFAVGPVLFTSFRAACCAWSAAACHRLDIVDGAL